MSAWPSRDGNGGAAGVGKNLGILEIIRRQMIKSVGFLPVVMVILSSKERINASNTYHSPALPLEDH